MCIILLTIKITANSAEEVLLLSIQTKYKYSHSQNE